MRRLLPALIALAALMPAGAGARTIDFQGHHVRVPAGWPVYRLAAHPGMCARLDRRAVYLGRPSASQRCPAGAIGRRRAILVNPAARARAAATPPPATLSAAPPFTGLGFDACAAPSRRAMEAWAGSPYRALGVYVGGINRACSQPNLTADWVVEQIDAGWHLMPLYVGLQAPSSDCGSCAKLGPGAASSQGAAAAEDAVERSREVGIGQGSPIYFDMESYSPGSSATSATLTFLGAWTARLHALGYVSGVYSSSASGVADLAARYGSGYLEPDDIWIANWNGLRSTSDPVVPSFAWSDHQRLKQYRGGHDESYGGVAINIDNDYVEGATVGTASTGEDPRGRLELTGSPRRGQVRVAGWAFDPSAPTEALSIRAYVGGRPGERDAVRYDLGPVAAQPRPDVALYHSVAGGNHGFDVSFVTTKTGRQPICVYAIDIGPGANKRLGCRTVVVHVAMVLSRLKASRRAVRLRLTCEWPAGVECPGQILLQARARVRRGRAIRILRTRLARRRFILTGGESQAYVVRLNGVARRLLAERRRLPARLLVAIPGGRLRRALALGRPR
jgi:glycoside hydrolase-like protein